MNKDNYFWYGVGALVLVLIGGIAYLVSQTSGDGRATAGTPAQVTELDHIRGTSTAKAVIIEYSDFQCPACATYEPVLLKLSETFGNDLAIVYRHFPLMQIHKNAASAVVASEASARQGKFWEMHDMLFARQDAWEKSVDASIEFRQYAVELGLDMAKYDADVQDETLKALPDSTFKEAVALGLSGTPSFFLNGELIESPRSYDEFETLLKEVIAKPVTP